MPPIVLTKESNEIQRVLTLKTNRNKRHRYEEFIIEGRVAIEQAYQQNWKIKSLFYNKDQKLSNWAKEILANQRYDSAYALSNVLMEKISDKTEQGDLLALIQIRKRDWVKYSPLPQEVVIVVDEPKSPGNLGMIIRSAVNFGASALILSGHAADPYDPQCIRASVGTFFSLPIYSIEGVKTFAKKIEALKQELELSIIASGDQGSTPLETIQFHSGVIFLVLGNETSGISLGYKQIADQFVKISLPGPFTSLNIGVAGSIFLYEIFRQRKKL